MFNKIWNFIKTAATRAVEALGAIVKGPIVGTGTLLLATGGAVAAAVAIVPVTLTATLANGPTAGVGSLGLLTAMTAGLPIVGALALVTSVLWGLVEAGSFIVRGHGLVEAEAWLHAQLQEWDQRGAEAVDARRSNRRTAHATPAAAR